MCVSLEVEGVDVVNELLAALREIGTNVSSAELRGEQRIDSSGVSNASVLEGLVLSGRDFVGPTESDVDDIANTFANVVETRLEKFARSRRARKMGVSTIEQLSSVDSAAAKRLATEVASAALRDAILAWMKRIDERIRTQKVATGKLEPLSESYAAHKRRRFGFEIPIGKASGQLLDNLDFSGTGSRNVRITRSK